MSMSMFLNFYIEFEYRIQKFDLRVGNYLLEKWQTFHNIQGSLSFDWSLKIEFFEETLLQIKHFEG